MRAKWEQNISESLVEQFYNKQTEEEIDAGFNETLSFGTAEYEIHLVLAQED